MPPNVRAEPASDLAEAHEWQDASRRRTVFAAMAGGVILGALVLGEVRKSFLTSLLLPPLARHMTFAVEPLSNPDILFPREGPYDLRLGYAALPSFIESLRSRQWKISAQARQSPAFRAWVKAGDYAVYPEKAITGLTVLDRSHAPLYSARFPENVYRSTTDIPPLVTETLLYIEDQHLLDPDRPRGNPAVDWPRFLLAIGGQIARTANQRLGQGGASTLATQIEKFRHSPHGRTGSYMEKLRQMATASLRAYSDGADTTQARRQLLAAYLNSVPLSSRPGYGEVIGIGDGLQVWYGTDLLDASRALASSAQDSRQLVRQAQVYKQVLSLLLAERRPAYYLGNRPQALEALSNRYLGLLCEHGIIDPRLRDAALRTTLDFRPAAPPPAAVPYAERKATDAIRTELMPLLRLSSVNSLDRLDLNVESTIDGTAQQHITDTLQRLADPGYAASLGLVGPELLRPKDLDRVAYSVLLYQGGADRNELRVRADSLNEPFDLNSGAKLMLGSTAKLRTLITYLDIVADLHRQLHELPKPQLQSLAREADDPLTRWAADYLAHSPDATLQTMLDAAMQRHYSGYPRQTFFTGGGAHVFHNFKRFEDAENPTVEDAFERSINLAFVRLMRDLTRYYIAQEGPQVKQLLSETDDPARQDYLRRFADQEGRRYLNRFYDDYRGLAPGAALDKLAGGAKAEMRALTVVFLSLRPESSTRELAQFLKAQLPLRAPDQRTVDSLYRNYVPERLTLADQGYLAGVHPLELWLVSYLRTHPDASRSDVMQAGELARRQAYDWLFRTRHSARQNERIGILLEQKAFERILEDWRRQGYPFSRLVPSLATAIGSSGDRPDSLAELMGIIVNDGLRRPAVDIDGLQFAAGTPYETSLRSVPVQAQRALAPEVAATVRRALGGVVERGTAQRLKGGYRGADGSPIPVAGKTGTGDNRLESFGAGRRLIASRVVNRSATFAFLIGDRYFGVITIYVPGPQAAGFHFTSALAVQLLRALEPAVGPLVAAVPSDGRMSQVALRRSSVTP